MKKLLLTFSFTVAAFVAFAQNYGYSDNTITFGLTGGTNLAFLQVKSVHRQEVYTNSENPFSLGLNADFKLTTIFPLGLVCFMRVKGEQ